MYPKRIPAKLRHLIYAFATRVLWSGSDRPGSMLRRGRPESNTFELNERFYFRFAHGDLEDGCMTLDRIRFPDQSVNRSGLQGKPWHVLIPQPGDTVEKSRRALLHGIVRIDATDIPASRVFGDKLFEFQVFHKPDEGNYCHCEIRAFENNEHIPESQRSKFKKGVRRKAKLYYREQLRRKLVPVLLAEPGSALSG